MNKEKFQDICFNTILPYWYSCPDTFPDFLIEIQEADKNNNEQLLNTYLPLFQEQCTSLPEKKDAQDTWLSEMDHYFEDFISRERILNILQFMDKKTFSSFEAETKHFMNKVRLFDPALSMNDIWQAIRNYFIYAIILEMEGKQQESPDSILAYSLLYPYTDNFIDGNGNRKKDKDKYNQLIKDTLNGITVIPSNKLEEKTISLLHMMIHSNPEEKGKSAAKLLLLMLDAQVISLKQQKKNLFSSLTEKEILEISVYKGGMSVLIDYFLSTGCLEDSKVRFFLEFGFILQLADDLQDLKEDKKKHSQTVMTCASKHHMLEQKVNQLLHFIYGTITAYKPENLHFREFVLQNCFLMILTSILSCRNYFSNEYLKQIEQYIPFSLSFFEQIQSGGKRNTPPAAESIRILDAFLDL